MKPNIYPVWILEAVVFNVTFQVYPLKNLVEPEPVFTVLLVYINICTGLTI